MFTLIKIKKKQKIKKKKDTKRPLDIGFNFSGFNSNIVILLCNQSFIRPKKLLNHSFNIFTLQSI